MLSSRLLLGPFGAFLGGSLFRVEGFRVQGASCVEGGGVSLASTRQSSCLSASYTKYLTDIICCDVPSPLILTVLDRNHNRRCYNPH